MATEMNAAIVAAIAAARVGDEESATAKLAEIAATMAPERRRRSELDIEGLTELQRVETRSRIPSTMVLRNSNEQFPGHLRRYDPQGIQSDVTIPPSRLYRLQPAL
jgi:hypothetical protein